MLWETLLKSTVPIFFLLNRVRNILWGSPSSLRCVRSGYACIYRFIFWRINILSKRNNGLNIWYCNYLPDISLFYKATGHTALLPLNYEPKGSWKAQLSSLVLSIPTPHLVYELRGRRQKSWECQEIAFFLSMGNEETQALSEGSCGCQCWMGDRRRGAIKGL